MPTASARPSVGPVTQHTRTLTSLIPIPIRKSSLERGSFATSFDREVPRFHGIEPSISLTYDSSAGNGLVGVGWQLQAGSYIARAGRRPAVGHDQRRPAADPFLDGLGS